MRTARPERIAFKALKLETGSEYGSDRLRTEAKLNAGFLARLHGVQHKLPARNHAIGQPGRILLLVTRFQSVEAAHIEGEPASGQIERLQAGDIRNQETCSFAEPGLSGFSAGIFDRGGYKVQPNRLPALPGHVDDVRPPWKACWTSTGVSSRSQFVIPKPYIIRLIKPFIAASFVVDYRLYETLYLISN